MQEQSASNNAQAEQIIKQVITAWASHNKAITVLFNKYEEDVYFNELAPGRNRAIYILGHLVASNDNLLPMFGLGEKLFPELEVIFSTNPDRFFPTIPSLDELKQYWEKLNTTLTSHFDKMKPEDWLARHTKVSEEDFAINPSRNKLNVLIGRTNHESYHTGQLAFLIQKELVG